MSVHKRVEEILGQLSLEEKLRYIGGLNEFYIREITAFNVPEIRMADGPMGVRNNTQSTAYPAGIALAATWNRELSARYGRALARDCRARGIHIILAPGVNIYRSPLCGRNFEYLGEDPFLAASMVVPAIEAIQKEGVLATVKHFAGNNQEYERHYVSSDIDERTLHEIYLPAFRAAVVDANVWCVMSAYNLLNGTWCSENPTLLKDILRDQWGFEGFVMSDWNAVHSTIPTANSGLDIEMPGGKFMNPETLTPAIESGEVSEAEIDSKVRNILRTILSAGFDKRPQKDASIPMDDPESIETAMAMAREAFVLLKNEGNVLPFDRASIRKLAVIGPNGHPGNPQGGGSSQGSPKRSISLSDALRSMLGDGVDIQHCPDGDGAEEIAKVADAVILSCGFNAKTEGEGFDRKFELPDNQADLIRRVAQANPRTAVVLNAGGSVDWAGWLEHTPALLLAWYPGQEGGIAIAETLFGDVNPSGKLPATFEKKWEDNPVYNSYFDHDTRRVAYTEGIFVGYRGYDEQNIEPMFCFGHGLSYTSFSYENLKVTGSAVSFTVRNTGAHPGAEVCQVYIRDVESSLPRPKRELKAYQKVYLEVGAAAEITIELDDSVWKFYDPAKHGWIEEPGEFEIMVGASSRDIRLVQKIHRN